MKTIGITGHSGYVGGVLSKKLSSNKGLELKFFDQKIQSLLDPSTLVDFVKDCDVVLHLASVIKPNDPNVLHVNVIGTANLLSAIVQTNPLCKFVLASSFEVYKASHNKELIDESYEKGPRSLYGLSKLMAEEVVSFYAFAHNIRATILRLTNIYGPSPNKSTSIVSIILDRIKNGTDLTIHGDGSQTRDYVYIDDVVRALELAADFNFPENLCTVNICSGTEVSILELTNKIEALLKTRAKIKFDPNVDGGGYRRGNNLLANKVLAWSPSVTFEEGLEKLVSTL